MLDIYRDNSVHQAAMSGAGKDFASWQMGVSAALLWPDRFNECKIVEIQDVRKHDTGT